jgi:serine/threonine-protein phosphatase 2A activator
MLDDISAVKTWDKVNSGMKKMYLAEVLGKLPVMQHFLFGSLLPFVEPRHSHSPSPESEANGAEGSSSENGQSCGHGHAHSHVPRNIHPRVLASLQARGEAPPSVGEQVNADSGGAGQRDVGWGDCCGIPVPSVFAAAAEENKEAKGGYTLSGVRPVPFD